MNARLCHALLAMTLISAAILAACERRLEPRFPHTLHMTASVDAGPGKPAYLACSSCHPGVRDANAPVYPDAAFCARCHADGRALPRQAAVRQIRFEHDSHLRMPEMHGQCVACHVGVTEGSEKRAFPTMPACLACHQRDYDESRCTLCHYSRARLRDLPPQTFMRHDYGWIRRHGPSATPHAAKICTQCHEQSFCTDCHDTRQPMPVEVRRPEAIESGAIHRGDFLTRHAIEASSQPATCSRCHTPPTCDNCHVARGVSAAAKGSTNPHPRGWISGDRSSPDFHGRAARHDILRCAACHDQGPATNCILCHKVGGVGGNPHPGGYSSGRSQGTDTPCRYCHGGS